MPGFRKLFASVGLCGALLLFSSCTFFRSMFHMYPSSNDRKIFGSYPLPPSPDYSEWICDDEECVLLIDTTNLLLVETHETNIVVRMEGNRSLVNIDSFLHKKSTTAFLVIENDHIVFERYYHGHDTSSLFQVFSVSKSFVATMVGLAIEDGFIKSIYDPVKLYQPNINSSLKQMRLVDLLDMRTGVNNTFVMTTDLYYGNNLEKIVQKGRLRSSIGNEFQYSNWATQQLMFVLESATQKSFGDYFKERLWDPIGMEYAGDWSMDSERYANLRAFGGLSLAARDLAKFGLLYLHDGVYAGKQLIPASWVKETIKLHHDDTEMFSMRGSDYPYNMHWRVIEDEKTICAVGLLGQFLYVDKPNNRIIIRLGDHEGRVDWIAFFKSMQIMQKNIPEPIDQETVLREKE